jgi:hypothetical protein
MCTGFWWESQKERDHLEDQGIDGRMESEWIQLAQDRGRWRAVVNYEPAGFGATELVTIL